MTDPQIPCDVKWCCALAISSSSLDRLCKIHYTHGKYVHPNRIERDPRLPKKWPPTPWDDDFERKRDPWL